MGTGRLRHPGERRTEVPRKSGSMTRLRGHHVCQTQKSARRHAPSTWGARRPSAAKRPVGASRSCGGRGARPACRVDGPCSEKRAPGRSTPRSSRPPAGGVGAAKIGGSEPPAAGDPAAGSEGRAAYHRPTSAAARHSPIQLPVRRSLLVEGDDGAGRITTVRRMVGMPVQDGRLDPGAVRSFRVRGKKRRPGAAEAPGRNALFSLDA